MNQVIIREMTIDDVERVAQIENATFSQPWSKKAFQSEINENNIAKYFVAEKSGNVVGYGGFWHVINEMHITNIAVDADFRGLGIGQALVCRILEYAKADELANSISLEVRRSNFAAQNLYRKYGFTVIGVRERYYEDNREDAYIMQIDI